MEKGPEHDSEAVGAAAADGGGADRRCSVTGSRMFYPSTRSLCDKAALELACGLQVYVEWKKLLHSLPPLMLVWSHLIDIFLTGRDPSL